jgi:8-oxo-dGTP pyrophosphatase MutT (NUDIX family)
MTPSSDSAPFSSLAERLVAGLVPDRHPLAPMTDMPRRAREAAVLIALTDEAEPRMLLTRRSPHLPTHPGELAFPGGKAEPGDVDLLGTALREAQEEVGLDPALFRFCGSLRRRETMLRAGVRAFVGVIPPVVELTAEAGEVAEILWVPASFFAAPANLRLDRGWHDGREHRLARYRWHRYTIWGMTAAFTVELMNCAWQAGLDDSVYRDGAAFRRPAADPALR